MRASPYPSYSDSGIECIGSIPTSWELTTLKYEVDSNRRITYGIVQAGPNIQSGVPYIRPADMSDEGGVGDVDSLLRTSESIAANYTRSSVRKDDLVCSIGPSFGKVMVVPDELNGANLTQGTARVAISSSNSSRYYFWALRSPNAFQQWESTVGGATFRALNLGPLAATYLPHPPPEEQSQIAKFLDYETAKIDALIEKQQQLIALLKEKRQAVISHAVTKGLSPNAPKRHSGVEWLGEIPAHWVVGKYKFCTTRVVVGIAEAATHAYADDGVPIIRSTNIKDDHLSQDELLFIKPEFADQNSSKYLYTNDIVTVRTGYPGVSAIVPKNLNKSQCFTNLIATPNPDCDPRFLCEFLNSHVGRMYFELHGWGSAQKNISVPILQNLPIAYPERAEQEQIADHIVKEREKFAPLLNRALEMIDVLQERRTALISAAVTGKIDVRDWKAPTSEMEEVVA